LEDGAARIGDLRERRALTYLKAAGLYFGTTDFDPCLLDPSPGLTIPIALLFHRPILVSFPPVRREREFLARYGLKPGGVASLLEDGYLRLVIDPLEGYKASRVDYSRLLSPENLPYIYPRETFRILNAHYLEALPESPLEGLVEMGYAHLAEALREEATALTALVGQEWAPFERLQGNDVVKAYSRASEVASEEAPPLPLELAMPLAQYGSWEDLYGRGPKDFETPEMTFDPRVAVEEFDEYIDLLKELDGAKAPRRAARRRSILARGKARLVAKGFLNSCQEEAEDVGEILATYAAGKLSVSTSFLGEYVLRDVGGEAMALFEGREDPILQGAMGRVEAVGTRLAEGLLLLADGDIPSLGRREATVDTIKALFKRYTFMPFQRHRAELRRSFASVPAIGPRDLDFEVVVQRLVGTRHRKA
jgi:hypothetical protein